MQLFLGDDIVLDKSYLFYYVVFDSCTNVKLHKDFILLRLFSFFLFFHMYMGDTKINDYCLLSTVFRYAANFKKLSLE